jgi:hypothetical protein
LKIIIVTKKMEEYYHLLAEKLCKIKIELEERLKTNTRSPGPSKYFSVSNFICGVMVTVLASSAVDNGFEPWLGQTKD